MGIYNLEENEDVYIAPRYYGSKFNYHMTRITSEINRNNIRTIDLKTDKLMVYGTEIKQSKLDRLHESLVLRPKSGIVFVNCNGAVYFYVPGKGCYRPIHNNVFDWSHFGVVVPNSALDSLRKQTETNEKEADETDELKDRLSTCRKDKQEVEMKLRKVCDQLSSLDFELENRKIELETTNKMVQDLEDQLCLSRKKSKKTEEELEKVSEKHSSATTQLEASNKRIMELEQQMSMIMRDDENKKTELRKVQEQLSTSNFELEITKTQLDSSNMRVKELEKELSSSKKERNDIEQELQKVKIEVSSVNSELESTKAHLESSKNRVEELEEKLTIYENEGKMTKMELERVQSDLSFARNELRSTKNRLETYEKQIQELKEKSCGSKTVIDQLKFIDSEVKTTNKKLDQLMISMMWNEHDHFRHHHRFLPSPCSFTLRTEPQGSDSGISCNEFAISIPIEEV